MSEFDRNAAIEYLVTEWQECFMKEELSEEYELLQEEAVALYVANDLQEDINDDVAAIEEGAIAEYMSGLMYHDLEDDYAELHAVAIATKTEELQKLSDDELQAYIHDLDLLSPVKWHAPQ